MGIDVQREIVISRTKSEVAGYAINPDNDPVWIGGIVEAEMVTSPPLSKGTKVRRVAKFLGRRMEYTPEVTEYVPDELLVMRADSPFDMTISYQFEGAEDGTRVCIRIQGGGSGFYRLAAPLLARSVKRNVTRDLKTLKAVLESRAE